MRWLACEGGTGEERSEARKDPTGECVHEKHRQAVQDQVFNEEPGGSLSVESQVPLPRQGKERANPPRQPDRRREDRRMVIELECPPRDAAPDRQRQAEQRRAVEPGRIPRANARIWQTGLLWPMRQLRTKPIL